MRFTPLSSQGRSRYTKNQRNRRIVPVTATPAPNSPLRIVMVAHSHGLGGIENHVVMLTEQLLARGHQVAFAGPKDSWMWQRITALGGTCMSLAMNGMYDPVSAWRLRGFARRWGADVLHGHAQRGARYARWAAGRAPMVATAHSTSAWKWFGHNHPIIAVSQAVRQTLLDKGFSAQAVRVIYPGTRDIGFQQPSDHIPLRLGILGRLEPVKGQDIALRALAQVRKTLPVTLSIIGPDTTDWAAQMKALTNELNLNDAVTFLGERHDLPTVFEQVDVFLAPSRREALSLSLIEAASAGKPCIGSNLGGIPEVIAPDVSGLLVQPESPDNLARPSPRWHRTAICAAVWPAPPARFSKTVSACTA